MTPTIAVAEQRTWYFVLKSFFSSKLAVYLIFSKMANLNRLRASALPSGSRVKSAELKSMEIGAFLTGCLELINLKVVSAKAASGMTLVLRIY